jgi:nitrate/TMAO reductase-like tetraheme cytochrome c subunit
MPEANFLAAHSAPAPTRRGRRRVLLIVLLAFAVLGLSGFGTTSFVLEESDEFCISCHRPPEQTYLNRARQARTGSAPIDLASVHMSTKKQTFNCIACHRGSADLGDRISSVTLGLRDTLIHVTGSADPSIEKRTAALPGLIEHSCVTCHTDTIVTAGFENHFHVKLPATWGVIQSGVKPIVPNDSPQALSDPRGKPELLNTSVTCLSCHVAHLSGFDFTKYLDQTGSVYPACNTCHMETGKGPIGLVP